MTKHQVVTQDEWVKARVELLAKEKEFTRLRDELSRERRALPWERVVKDYRFEGLDGEESLSDLFDGSGVNLPSRGCVRCSVLVVLDLAGFLAGLLRALRLAGPRYWQARDVLLAAVQALRLPALRS